MSGEAYGNLWVKDPDELWQAQEHLERMAERLAGMGHADAAGETFAVLAEVRAQHARLEASTRRLSDLWKAVDYLDSSDWGPEPVAKALAEYREGDMRGRELATRQAELVDDVRRDYDGLIGPITVPDLLAEYQGDLDNPKDNT